jgi:hypothetical protein
MDLHHVLRDILRGGRFNVSIFAVFFCDECVDKSTEVSLFYLLEPLLSSLLFFKNSFVHVE